MDKVKILVAEDDRDDYLFLKEAIEEVLPKFNMYHSRDGYDFLQKIEDGLDPDLIFLDLNMPKKNGIECLIEVRQKTGMQSPPIPIIIYSTSSDFEDIDRCYKNGCTLYLVKPVSFNDLVNQIRKVFFRLGLPKKDLLYKEMFVVKKHE